MSSATTPTVKLKKPPLRFAHPFFTTTPPKRRRPTPFGRRMIDHVQSKLQPIPKPRRDPMMTLADIIGPDAAAAIEKSGALRFHSTGDTGRSADSPQGQVAAAMTADYDIQHPAQSPAFFFHLGDVIYGHSKDQLYRREFYEPYMHYPGKIIGIPGNHDGEVFPQSDPTTLRAFEANFCAATPTVPPIAGTIFRETMTQPGVYWLLDAPFVDVIGLYSNVGEGPGFISGGAAGQAQKTWLVATLQRIKKERDAGKRKGLILATHHPAFSNAGHSGSDQMLKDIDEACTKGGVMPDIFLAGHSHTYQRYTRRIRFAQRSLEIPFVVAGIGGINDQPVPPANGQVQGDHSFDASHQGFGYLLIEAKATGIEVRAIGVTGTAKSQVDQVAVTL